MSKLTPHQIRAMIDGVTATIYRYEAESPTTNATLRKLSKAHARLDLYRAELAERTAAEVLR